jgi:mevalonate kinase
MKMSPTLSLTIPGKTFLAGEYLALKGLGALVFASKPKFQFLIKEVPEKSRGEPLKGPFHPDSPAGLFWQEQIDFFSKYTIELKSVLRLGGWGSSTAEFIALHALYQLRETLWIEQERIFDLHQMLRDYRRLAGVQSLGFPPSGADLVGQVAGGLTHFNGLDGKIQTFSWPFEKLKLKLLATGRKLATHEHLKTLKDFPTEGLQSAVDLCHQGLKAVDDARFIEGLKLVSEALSGLGFVAPETQRLLEQFQMPGLLAAKGCGALGADVILLCYREDEVGSGIEKRARALGLQVVATEASLCDGLQVQRLLP